MAHVLSGQMLVLIYHVGVGEVVMAEGGLILMQPCGNHGASVGGGLGHCCTGCPRRMRLNGAAREMQCSNADGLRLL
jgi:hypothetical protein